MRLPKKEKCKRTPNESVDLKNKNWVEGDHFFLDSFFSIGGSVSAERLSMKKEEAAAIAKAEAEKLAQEQFMTEATTGVVFPEAA